MAEAIHAFWQHAVTYYRNPDGTPAGELDNYRLALRPLRRLYCSHPVCDFGPTSLKAIRAEMMKPRTVIDPVTGAS